MIRHRLEYRDKRMNPAWSWRWKLLFIALGLAVPAVISFIPIWPARFCANNVVRPAAIANDALEGGIFFFLRIGSG